MNMLVLRTFFTYLIVFLECIRKNRMICIIFIILKIYNENNTLRAVLS